MLYVDHADFTAPNRQHELDHTDHTDHTDNTDNTDHTHHTDHRDELSDVIGLESNSCTPPPYRGIAR